MTFWVVAAMVVSCLISGAYSPQECWREHLVTGADLGGSVAGTQIRQAPELTPIFSVNSADVVLTAEAALAWDEQTGAILYEKNIDERRPVASLSKLLSALAIRDTLSTSAVVVDRKSTRLNSSHTDISRMPSSA